MRSRERKREGETKIEAGTPVEGRGRRRDWRGLAEAADEKGMGGGAEEWRREGREGEGGGEKRERAVGPKGWFLLPVFIS